MELHNVIINVITSYPLFSPRSWFRCMHIADIMIRTMPTTKELCKVKNLSVAKQASNQIFHYTRCITLKRVASWRDPSPCYYTRITQLLSIKCGIGDEPLAIRLDRVRDLNLRPPASEKNATYWPVNIQKSLICTSTYVIRHFVWHDSAVSRYRNQKGGR